VRIEALAIGTELLTTRRLDTNSVWIAERLARLGFAFHRKSCVGDSREDLRALYAEALGRSELIITTGGLGPTFDDFTKELFAEMVGAELKEDALCRADLDAFYARRNRVPSANNLKQVLIPEGAEALRNPLGTAPGLWWEDPPGHPGRTIVMLPGVPREMQRLWLDHVEPRLAGRAGRAIHTLRMVVGGVPESTLDDRTAELRERHRDLEWTILASLGQVELVARGLDPAALASAEADFRDLLGRDLVAVGDLNLEDAVLRHLQTRGETLAVAESMPGGQLSALLTAVPGSSVAFLGGATVYSVEAKVQLLGVDPALIQAHGTVSEAVTLELARRVRAKLGATWGLAVTGNAGPGLDPAGATAVGDTVMAVDGPKGHEVRRFTAPGERKDIQLRGASWALDLLRRQLLG
jgi:nicotinamide-nucleotide amidase